MRRCLLALVAVAVLALSESQSTAVERAAASSFTPTKGGVNLALSSTGDDDEDGDDGKGGDDKGAGDGKDGKGDDDGKKDGEEPPYKPDFNTERTLSVFRELAAAGKYDFYLKEVAKRGMKVSVLVPNNEAWEKSIWNLKSATDDARNFRDQMYYMTIPGNHTADELSRRCFSTTILAMQNKDNMYSLMFSKQSREEGQRPLVVGYKGVQAVFVEGLQNIETDFGYVHVINNVINPPPPPPAGPTTALRGENKLQADAGKLAVGCTQSSEMEAQAAAAFHLGVQAAERLATAEEQQMPEPFFWLM